MASIDSNLQTLLEPSLTAMGYRIVQLKLGESGKRRTLSIMAERVDGKRIEVSDCEAISHRASALLDVENAIDGAYDLEVASPGIDRPLTRAQDYKDYLSFEAKLELHIPQGDRKRFRGTLEAADDAAVTVLCDSETYTLPYANIRTAKLVLTDALIKESMKRAGK